MSYNTQEISAAAGQPVELYRFVLGQLVWTVTSGREAITYQVESYQPAVIRRSAVEQSPEFARNGIDLECARDFAVAQLFAAARPNGVVSLTVFRNHLGDSEYITWWKGRVSLLWDREQPLEEFIAEILRHIDGTLYVHPRTGKFVLKLARADYNVSSLLVLDASNILELESFSRPSESELVNQITVRYRDRSTDKDAAITVHDLAALELAGGVVSSATVDYPGISNGSLASRVALGDLKQLSVPLAKATLIANRQASNLNIGDVFKFTWPELGIAQLVMRVVRVSYGTLTDGRVRIECVEDIFGLPSASYVSPTPTSWVSPLTSPAPVPYRRLTIPQEEFEAMLELAAERGARHALADVGLDGPEAAHDIRELRGLLDAFNEAKKTAGLTVVKMLVTGLVMALLAGAFLKLKLFGGGQ